MTETIRVREDVVTLRSDRPKHLGTKIDLEVKLPEGVLLQSFTLNGTITSCEYVSDLPAIATGASIEAAQCARRWQAGNGSGSYILEVKIGDISPMNKKILKAYIDFLEREDMLKGIEMDLKALQQVFSHFGQRLSQLRATSELMRSELEGILELLMRNPGRKITIH